MTLEQKVKFVVNKALVLNFSAWEGNYFLERVGVANQNFVQKLYSYTHVRIFYFIVTLQK